MGTTVIGHPFLSLALAMSIARGNAFLLSRYHHVVGISSSIATFTLCSTSPSLVTSPEFTGAFDADRMDALTERGRLEASLMPPPGLLEEVKKNANNNKKKKKSTNKKNRPSTAILARALRQEGVVRLNNILSPDTASALRAAILERRSEAYAAVQQDSGSWRQYFADVLLKRHRCDLLLPLQGNALLQTALHEILVASPTLSDILQMESGEDAVLYELSALISEPGAPRQPVHPDNPHQEHAPLHTVFIALQNITANMGPTLFLPQTNTALAHEQFNNVPQRDAFLESRPNVAALLDTGDASLFDSRTLHCGGANDANESVTTRVLLYLSFRNPHATEPIGNVGSLLPEIPPMTLRELRTKLATTNLKKKNDKNTDPFGKQDLAEDNEALCLSARNGDATAQLTLGIQHYVRAGETSGQESERDSIQAVQWFEQAAVQGLAQAQFNLGCCFALGVGVGQPDLERAVELLQQAADQNHPGASQALEETKTNLKQQQQQQQ